MQVNVSGADGRGLETVVSKVESKLFPQAKCRLGCTRATNQHDFLFSGSHKVSVVFAIRFVEFRIQPRGHHLRLVPHWVVRLRVGKRVAR